MLKSQILQQVQNHNKKKTLTKVPSEKENITGFNKIIWFISVAVKIGVGDGRTKNF